MNKFFIFGSIVLVLIFGVIVFKPFKSKENVLSVQNQQQITPTPIIKTSLPSGAETIEVLHFHATQQCYSCTSVGEYTLKTIKEKFPEEYESGKITFKGVNSEIIENREIVNKFKARGSSLYINAIKDSQDHIEEDVTVWRLVGNQTQFINYLETKLKKIL